MTFWAGSVAVFLAAVLPFIRSFSYGIVNLDDYWYVAMHDPIIAGLGMDGIKFAFTSLDEAIWMPLTWISFMIDHSLFGMGSWGAFHAHSILLHGLNAVLVYLLLRRIVGFTAGGRARPLDFICAVAAMIWACHPLRCESAVFIASRKDVLSLFFELLAMLLWFKDGRRYYWASIVSFMLAGMAKPSVMTFPLLCFLVDFFIRRSASPIKYALPLAMAAALGWFAGFAQAAGGATEDVFGSPFWYKLVNAATSFGLYLWNTVWPLDLAAEYLIRWPECPRLCFLGIPICVVACVWLARRLWRLKKRFNDEVEIVWHGLSPEWKLRGEAEPVFAGLMWFALAIAPMLGIAGFGLHSMADRFTYIPSIGLSIAIAAFLASRVRPEKTFAIHYCLLPVVAALAAMTWRQTGFWKDDFTLFSRTLEVDGDKNALAHGLLANWYFEFPHDLKKCTDHYERMVELCPRLAETYFLAYAFALCESGREKEMPDQLKAFDKWVHEKIEENPRLGKDSSRAKFTRNIYHLARVAYLITQPDLRKVAAEMIDAATCPADDSTILYLKWRLALAEDGEAAAEPARLAILEKGKTKSYVQFRYLRNAEMHK